MALDADRRDVLGRNALMALTHFGTPGDIAAAALGSASAARNPPALTASDEMSIRSRPNAPDSTACRVGSRG